ncbi:hypothetical protein COU01_00695, partial [Candidatus Falkowbacteria bacterium CG10_big_fil_rev_8_21_14_0_10_44_15]
MDFITLLPLFSAILVFVLGMFVVSKNIKSKVNITFFLFCFAVTIWMFGTYMMFLNKDNHDTAIFWDRFVYLGVTFIPIFMYHLSTAITYDTKKITKYLLAIGYILSTIFFFTVFTPHFVNDLFIYKWGVHTKAQILHHLFLIYFFIYIVLYFVWLYRYYKKTASPIERQKIKYFFIAFFILAAIGPLAYLPAYGIGIYPFAYVSGLIFASILAYAILRYRLMDIRIVARRIFFYIGAAIFTYAIYY